MTCSHDNGALLPTCLQHTGCHSSNRQPLAILMQQLHLLRMGMAKMAHLSIT